MQKFDINPNTVYREEDDGAFLFDPKTGAIKFMNWSAKEVFLLLKERRDLEYAVDKLTSQFPDVESSQIKEDVSSFVEQLTTDGFVSPCND